MLSYQLRIILRHPFASVNYLVVFISFITVLLAACGNEGAKDQESNIKGAKEEISSEKPTADNLHNNANIEIFTFQNEPSDATAETEAGWGYEVYIEGKRYIRQPHIPAIQGIRGFGTREDAQKAAELMIHKIRNNILPPSISIEELKDLEVLDSLSLNKQTEQ